MVDADNLARHTAWSLGSGYDEGLEAYVSARSEDASVILSVTPDGEPTQRFRAVFVEIKEEIKNDDES